MAAVLAHQMRLEDRLSPSQIPLFPLFAAPSWCAIKLLRGLARACHICIRGGGFCWWWVCWLARSSAASGASSFLKPFAIHLRFFQLWMMTDSVKLLIVAFYGLCILHGHLAFSFIFQSLSYYLRTSTPPFLVPPSHHAVCLHSVHLAPGQDEASEQNNWEQEPRAALGSSPGPLTKLINLLGIST